MSGLVGAVLALSAPQYRPSSLRHNCDVSAPNPDALPLRGTPADVAVAPDRDEPAPTLFVQWDGQRRPRCYGRVVHPWDSRAVSERQHKARFLARQWWVVLCSSAEAGRLVIEKIRPLQVPQSTTQILERFEALRPIARLVLDCGKNARMGRGVAHV